ncbi:MAG: glycosyltransferase family 47 protein [Candidatus Pacebacteria bacterium]|nr:glycosyltransferase family 47 protein [Candidatus Paceibacterota bacterium]
MRILVTSLSPRAEKFKQVEKRLKELHAQAREHTHELVDEPAEADIILLGNIRDENHYKLVRDSAFLATYHNKTFAVTALDRPVYVLHGIYSGAEKTPLRCGRIRSGSYAIFQNRFRNPEIGKAAKASQNNKNPRYLFSFMGTNNNWVRNTLINQTYERQDVYLTDATGVYSYSSDRNAAKETMQSHYARVLAQSKFALCPRGIGASSLRLFEALELGVAPVIISDAWLPCEGPDWNTFCIFVKEKDTRRIEAILKQHEAEYAERGKLARQAFERFFADHNYFNYLVSLCQSIQRTQKIPESVFWRTRHITFWLHMLWRKQYNARKRIGHRFARTRTTGRKATCQQFPKSRDKNRRA